MASALTADTFEGAVLKHAEQSDLCRKRQLADLIEEKSAPVRSFEPSLPRRGGARECPTLMAKELGVDELVWDRPAIDAMERSLRATRAVMRQSRDDFFSRTRFAEQQDGQIRPCNLFDARD
jgi:hypothetical protein